MKRLLQTLVFFLLVFFLNPAAYAGEVRGKIVSVFRGEPLGKVLVTIVGTQMSVTTENDGWFKMENVPAGRYTLQVSSVGFRTISVPFTTAEGEDMKEFTITLVPANFRRTDVVEVKGDIFQAENAAVPSQFNLTATEIKESSTVLADDPFRAVQALPGVVPSSNNDFFGEFSVRGAPFSKVSVYVDDVLVPEPFHTIPDLNDGASLSIFSAETVDALTLMPVAFPERYGDSSGAALDIHTREGSRTGPLFTASIGMADSNFIAEGALGKGHKGSWLASARKSYLGYLVQRESGEPFTDIAFEDADVKLTYDLNSRQNVSLYAIDGHSTLNQSGDGLTANDLKNGGNDLTLARLGWNDAVTPQLLVDSHAAYLRQKFNTQNSSGENLTADYYGEWIGATRTVWDWGKGQVLEAGYTARRLRDGGYQVLFSGPAAVLGSLSDATGLRQSGYLQQTSGFFNHRLVLMAGVRWDAIQQVDAQPVSPQVSAAFQAAPHTLFQFGFGRYAQFPDFSTLAFVCSAFFPGSGAFAGELLERSNHYTAAVEERFGENIRLRVEGFDRENRQLAGGRVFTPSGCGPVVASPNPPPAAPGIATRDYSRGVEILIQRRSANRLSGWIGYTLDYAQQQLPLTPAALLGLGALTSGPTDQDQRHTVNAFGMYRLTSTMNLTGKWIYGSGIPIPGFAVEPGTAVPIAFNQTRLGPYERLDLRVDKAWTFEHWKMTLSGEGLNLTNHNNPRLLFVNVDPVTGQPNAVTEKGLPITPTAGVVFEF